MDAFHIACAFLAVLGCRFTDAGLRGLLLESRRVGPNAVSKYFVPQGCDSSCVSCLVARVHRMVEGTGHRDQ